MMRRFNNVIRVCALHKIFAVAVSMVWFGYAHGQSLVVGTHSAQQEGVEVNLGVLDMLSRPQQNATASHSQSHRSESSTPRTPSSTRSQPAQTTRNVTAQNMTAQNTPDRTSSAENREIAEAATADPDQNSSSQPGEVNGAIVDDVSSADDTPGEDSTDAGNSDEESTSVNDQITDAVSQDDAMDTDDSGQQPIVVNEQMTDTVSEHNTTNANANASGEEPTSVNDQITDAVSTQMDGSQMAEEDTFSSPPENDDSTRVAAAWVEPPSALITNLQNQPLQPVTVPDSEISSPSQNVPGYSPASIEPLQALPESTTPLAIRFPVGQARLEEDSVARLSEFARLIQEEGVTADIMLIARGDAGEANQMAQRRLSLERGREVQNVLVELGLPRRQLVFSDRETDYPVDSQGMNADTNMLIYVAQ